MLADIDLKFAIKGPELDAAAVEQAVKVAEEQLCPARVMLKGGPKITSSVKVLG